MDENRSHPVRCQHIQTEELFSIEVPSPRRLNWRKLFFELHGWVGLNLGLILFVVCLSGTFATLSDEMDALIDPARSIDTHTGNKSEYDWTAMTLNLESSFPDGVVQTIYAPGASGRPSDLGRTTALAFVAVPSGETRKVSVDPYTGEVLGHTGFFNTERFFRTFHRRLFDGGRGILIVTLTSFFLLASAITGFAFYGGWLRQLRTLKLFGTRRRRWSDLHKVAGIWGLPFTLIIAITGVYYFVEVSYQRMDAYEQLLSPPMAQVDISGLAEFGPQPELLTPNRYIQLARETFPQLDIRTLRMSHSPSQAVYVDGRGGDPFTRDRADKIHLHPLTGEIIDVQKSSNLGLVPYMTEAVDPIHFGYFGGLTTQLIWFILGLLLSFSILSGMYVWVVRSLAARTRPSSLLRGAPISVAVTITYLALAGFSTANGIRAYSSPVNEPIRIGSVEVGPWSARVDCSVPCRPAEGARVTARFLGSGLPNYERAEFVTEQGSVLRLTGPAWKPRTELEFTPGEKSVLRVTDRTGHVYQAAFTPNIERVDLGEPAMWPDTAQGVWWIVIGFGILMVGSIVVWLSMILRVARERS